MNGFQWQTEDTSFLDGIWFVYYSDPNDEFLRFYLCYNRKGDLIFDSYEEYYLKGATIYEYYSNMYREYFVNIHDEIYDSSKCVTWTSATSIFSYTHGEAYFKDYSPIGNEPYNGPILDINKEYTMEDLANEYGCLQFIYKVDDEDKTAKDIYEKRLEIRNIIDEYNIPFKEINIAHDFSSCIFGLTREDLYSDSLEQIINDNYENLIEEANKVTDK